MMCARLYSPATIIAVDVNDHRLNVAKENGLCDIALNKIISSSLQVF